MSDSILIIGATGSVGVEVATRLTKQKHSVKIAVRNPEKAQSTHISGAEFVHFDYQQQETFEPAFDGIDKVLLVSPPSYLKLQNNVKQAIDAAVKKGVNLIVNISAISMDTELDRPMKVIAEHIKNCGVNYVLLCPNCYMQNFKDLFKTFIIEDNIIAVPAGESKTSFVDIRDVAEVAVKVLMDDKLINNTYKLTGKQLLNMNLVANLFSKKLAKEIGYKNISNDYFVETLHKAGWPEGTIEGTLQLCSHVKNGDTEIVADDIEKILGREPIKFEKFIQDYSSDWS